MALPLKEKENNSPAEAFVFLHCPFESCEKFYKNKKKFLEHFSLYPAHKPETVLRKRKTIKDTVETFLNRETTYSRSQRVRELILQLTDEEIVAFTLPRVVDIVPPVDVFWKEALVPVMFSRNWSTLGNKFVFASRNLKLSSTQVPLFLLPIKTKSRNLLIWSFRTRAIVASGC